MKGELSKLEAVEVEHIQYDGTDIEELSHEELVKVTKALFRALREKEREEMDERRAQTDAPG